MMKKDISANLYQKCSILKGKDIASSIAAVAAAPSDAWALNIKVSTLAAPKASFIHRVRVEDDTGLWGRM